MHKNKKLKKDHSPSITSFSKDLLGLKFMQRAKKEVEKVAQEEEESFNLNLSKNVKNKQQYIINQSYQFCERLKFGRLSFRGMNSDIENLDKEQLNSEDS